MPGQRPEHSIAESPGSPEKASGPEKAARRLWPDFGLQIPAPTQQADKARRHPMISNPPSRWTNLPPAQSYLASSEVVRPKGIMQKKHCAVGIAILGCTGVVNTPNELSLTLHDRKASHCMAL